MVSMILMMVLYKWGEYWSSAVEYFSYQARLENMLDNLKTTCEDLTALKRSVVRRVRSADRKGMEPIPVVLLWTERVGRMEFEVEALLIEGDQEIGRICLGGVLPTNCSGSARFWDALVKCQEELAHMKAAGVEFEEVALGVPEMRSHDRIVGLEEKLSEVLNYLNQEETSIVGLYGMGGIGKTTLLKLIADHFSLQSNFHVIWIEVSKDADVEMIQKDVAENIGLPVELMQNLTSLEERALHICKELERKQFILLLDDMQEAFDLSKIGVPPSLSLHGSKIVLTTRNKSVSLKMGAQENVDVGHLDNEQAWRLFVMSVGKDTINSDPKIQYSARRVVQMCGGLPINLTTVGKAMSAKTEPEEWRRCIRHLKRSLYSEDEDEDEEEEEEEKQDKPLSIFISILRVSYDLLPNEKVKSCLLYCTLFPVDFQIHKKALAEFFICEKFWIVQDHDEMDFHYDEAYSILGTLVGAALLNENGDWITMHDAIRDVVLHLGKEDTCVMSGLKLKEAPNVRVWQQMKRVSLMHNDIEELTEVPESPLLLTLLLDNNQGLRKICDGFFESMAKLTVLSLSCSSVEELPRSISRLVSLTSLDISYTKIRKLPVVLKELKKLKYVNLSGLFLTLKRSERAIGSLSSLQILKMICKYHYVEEGASTSKSSDHDDIMLIEELLCLEHVQVLQLTLGSLSGLKKLISTRRLWRKIETLRLNNFKAPPIDVSLLAHTKNLDLSITSCDFPELSVDDTKGGLGRATFSYKPFSGITRVAVCNCDYLEHLTCLALMTNLTVLKVSDCMSLKEVINGEKVQKFLDEDRSLEPFYHLAVLELCRLPRLLHIYSSNLSFRSLHQLRVCDCLLLEKLPLGSISVIGPCIELIAAKSWFDKIIWEDAATKAALLPRLDLTQSSTTNTKRYPMEPTEEEASDRLNQEE